MLLILTGEEEEEQGFVIASSFAVARKARAAIGAAAVGEVGRKGVRAMEEGRAMAWSTDRHAMFLRPLEKRRGGGRREEGGERGGRRGERESKRPNAADQMGAIGCALALNFGLDRSVVFE
jgi:hypothetical protein